MDIPKQNEGEKTKMRIQKAYMTENHRSTPGPIFYCTNDCPFCYAVHCGNGARTVQDQSLEATLNDIVNCPKRQQKETFYESSRLQTNTAKYYRPTSFNIHNSS